MIFSCKKRRYWCYNECNKIKVSGVIMGIILIHVGQLKEKYFADAVAEYEKRLSSFCRVTNVLIKDIPVESEAQISSVLQSEGERILQVMSKHPKCLFVALCIESKGYSTYDLLALLEKATHNGQDLGFIIGGSHGLSDKVKTACAERMSMSGMTFPHRLARVMLLEQIYRCSSIIKGSKYHK